jgi:hypothetical protein
VTSSVFYGCKCYFEIGSVDDFDGVWPFLACFVDIGLTLPDEGSDLLTLIVLNIANVVNPGALRDTIFLYLARIA